MHISERIKELRKYLKYNQSEFSNKMDTPQSTLSQYENGTTRVPFDFVEKIANDFKISPDWLLTGRGEMYYHANGKPAAQDGNEACIEVLSASASAGHGVQNYDVAVIDKIPVPAAIVRPYADDKVKAMVVKGDSMTPVIFNGDFVLYVPGEVQENGIYVIEVFGELRCKRLEFKLNGDINVISDNDRYEKECFKRGDDTLRICGRVIGWIHKHNY